MPIEWSCVARDGIVLAEAGSDDGKGRVVRAAQRLHRMRPTAGWEKTRSLKDAPYRGIKLHVYEPVGEDGDVVVDGQPPDSDRCMIWTFCCVYNSKEISEGCVKAFLAKIVYVTEALRSMPWWREGSTLSAQPSFAPTLRQQMEGAARAGDVAVLHQHVEETKAIMARNIRSILDRGERIEDLQAESEQLNDMARVFKKRARQLKRYKMWNNAKHGVMVGTTVTGVVGAIVIPPLIALL